MGSRRVIYSPTLVFKGGTHGDTLRIIPEARMQELAPALPEDLTEGQGLPRRSRPRGRLAETGACPAPAPGTITRLKSTT